MMPSQQIFLPLQSVALADLEKYNKLCGALIWKNLMSPQSPRAPGAESLSKQSDDGPA